MRTVVLHQARLPGYRAEVFRRLQQECAAHDIDFTLVTGQATEAEMTRGDDTGTADDPFITRVRNRFVTVRGRTLLWQPRPAVSREADLAVFSQENRILSNYPALLAPGARRTGFFGHGANFQSASKPGSTDLGERWKRRWAGSVDWWYAYTELSAAAVRSAGYDAARITVLNNAIDMDGLTRDAASLTGAELVALREGHGIAAGAPVAVYCGALYPHKRLDLLLSACALVQASVPDFTLVVLGDGPSAGEIRRAADQHHWIRYLGARMGRDKAAWFRTARVMLNPGALGLHVLDAFAVGLPLVSTVRALHGPEIAYVDNGRNAVLVDDDSPQGYASAVRRVLEEAPYHDALSQAALADAGRYTLDKMVRNFRVGFEACLAAPRRQR